MGKTILIVGASSGIGEYCARKLDKDGNKLILVARRIELLEKLKEDIGCEAYCFRFDVSDTDNIKSIFDFCKEKGLMLDAMIYCAGIDYECPIKLLDYSHMDNVMRINFYGFVQAIRFFSNARYANKYSKIVAISSSASISNDKGMAIYSASKAALNSVVKTSSKEFIRRGILVNAILPTGVLTPMTVEKMAVYENYNIQDIKSMIDNMDSSEISINVENVQPLGLISPRAIADLAEFLISDNNRYMTGTLIPVSSGCVN